MSFYTKTGDNGTTSLYGGKRVPKTSLQVKAYGAIDETAAFVGVAREASDSEEIWQPLHFLIRGLMVCSTLLGAEPKKAEELTFVCDEDIEGIESMIDHLAEEIGPIEGFVLFDCCDGACKMNLARAVTRRAERDVLEFLESEPKLASLEQYRNVPIFLNRASDLLFACACFQQILCMGELEYADA